MDWLKGMNEVVKYIEENLTNSIDYTVLAKKVCCSPYEFSRIFSFMTGISVSEYIRRRKLSQVVFDIKNSDEKIIDIALKYGYESQTAFSRAFKEIHGQSPTSARKKGVNFKTYPKITFSLSIRGVNEMNFRIETKHSFKIVGLKGLSSGYPENGDTLDPLWRQFMDNYDFKLAGLYREPFWQVGAYWNEDIDDNTPCIIGAERNEKAEFTNMDIETIPATTWAVFSITGLNDKVNKEVIDETYARIYIEWMPSSNYKRNEVIQHLEVYDPGDASSEDYIWEIWIPVIEDDTSSNRP